MRKYNKNLALPLGLLALALSGIFIVRQQSSTPKDVVLVTHDSFVMSQDLIKSFKTRTGYNLSIVKAGDTGSLVNRLTLTKNAPIADVVFGIDNTFADYAKENGILASELTATDFGDVCFNYDKAWFATNNIPAPTGLEDLVKPEYRGLTVVTNPKTSSPGMALLAATIDKFGEQGWQSYWTALRDNDVKVTDGWDTAYFTEFSGSSGKGNYPIVLSYASSPASEVRSNGQSQTANLNDGCYRQTEFVAVLHGAKNPKGAQAVIEFLLSEQFQKTFPTAMYMYPIDASVAIPTEWEKFAQPAHHTYGSDLDVATNRRDWLKQWSAIFD